MSELASRKWARAQQYLANGQADAARIALESLLQRDPEHVEAQLALSGLSLAAGHVRDATALALKAAARLPDDAAVICDAAEALYQVGERVAARACLERPVVAHATDGNVLMRLAALRKLLEEHTQALALYERAVGQGLGDAEFRLQYANELMFNGRMREAEGELEACLCMQPAFGRAALARARLRRQTQQGNHLADLEQRLQRIQPGSEHHAALEFARYKELEDIGRHAAAWDALAHGNALMFARQRHDPMYAERLFDALAACCTPQMLQPGEGSHEGPQPIFIVGMPRSGTTLFERVLGNHSQVASAGELDDFGMQLRWATNHRVTLDEHVLHCLPGLDYAEIGRRYLAQTQWRANGARYFIDKQPRNWMVAGLIQRALPGARILNLVRDPMDVCFSNYRILLGDGSPWSYDLHALAAHYRQYRKLMAHWRAAMPGRIHDVSYEQLTRHPEATAREALSFCGLEWEAGCADVTRNASAVATLSMVQVREPIHARAFGEWRPYERQLAPLRELLAGV